MAENSEITTLRKLAADSFLFVGTSALRLASRQKLMSALWQRIIAIMK